MQPCGTCALEPMKYGPHPQLLQMYVAVYRVSLLCLVCSALVAMFSMDCARSVFHVPARQIN